MQRKNLSKTISTNAGQKTTLKKKNSKSETHV